MLLEEIRKEEHDAGYEQGTIEVHHNHIMSFLSGLAPVPENLKNQIISIVDIEVLSTLVKNLPE